VETDRTTDADGEMASMVIVCLCAGVTEQTITSLIAAGARTVTEITRRCGAGRCCAPCRDEIEALLYKPQGGKHTPLASPPCAAIAAAAAE
jgi:bacterioferritin-associated ferredoxin